MTKVQPTRAERLLADVASRIESKAKNEGRQFTKTEIELAYQEALRVVREAITETLAEVQEQKR